MADSKPKNSQKDGAPKVSDAANSEQPGSYKDNPDKPDPTSVAQVQVLPDES